MVLKISFPYETGRPRASAAKTEGIALQAFAEPVSTGKTYFQAQILMRKVRSSLEVYLHHGVGRVVVSEAFRR